MHQNKNKTEDLLNNNSNMNKKILEIELYSMHVYQTTELPQVKLVIDIDFHWFNALIGIANLF